MTELSLSIFNTKRLLRCRQLSAVLLAVPFIAAVIRQIFSSSDWSAVGARLCPFGCVLLIGGILFIQWIMDVRSGLIDGLVNCLGLRRKVVVSRVLCGVTIFAAQMLVFVLILSIRF